MRGKKRRSRISKISKKRADWQRAAGVVLEIVRNLRAANLPFKHSGVVGGVTSSAAHVGSGEQVLSKNAQLELLNLYKRK